MKKKNQKGTLYGIIGLGQFGSSLAQKLAESGAEVLVIDNNESKIREALEYTENAFVVGALTRETLRDVGIQNCDVVVVCIGEKIDVSVLTTLNVSSLGVPRIIAKAMSAEHGLVLEKLGADVVYPEHDMAVRLANKLLSSRVIDFMALSEEVEITEIKLTARMDGVTVRDSELRRLYGLNIIALRRGDKIITDITPELKLLESDTIVVVGKHTSINGFQDYLSANK